MKCFYQLCVVSIYAESGQHVNVTILKMTTYELCDRSCRYSGLVAGEKLRDDYSQSDTLCKNHDQANFTSRSFYSYNSSLKLIMYWYKGYSDIKVSVHISQTNCEPLKIDVCKIDTYTCIQSECNYFQSEYNYYLKNVTKYSLNEIYNVGKYFYFKQTNGKRCVGFSLSTKILVAWK